MIEAQTTFAIRERTPDDDDTIEAVVRAAFRGPDEAALIGALRRDGDMVCEFVAVRQDVVVGHVAFSRLAVRSGSQDLRATALAPLAVVPTLQRSRIGDALTRHALERLRESGEELCVVLGHPAYYPRFGFSDLLGRLLDAPYAGPSFMALELVPGVLGALRWKVTYAKAFGPAH